VHEIVSPSENPAGTGVMDSAELAELKSDLETTLAPEIKSQTISVHREPDGLVISLREAGFFESGAARMRSISQAPLDRIAKLLQPHNYRLRIEGHTDNTPIHTAGFPSNWELSTSRSTEMVRLLIVRYGFNPDGLSAAGFAQYHPVATNQTAEGRGMNRRVDIVILGHGAMIDSAARINAKSMSVVKTADNH